MTHSLLKIEKFEKNIQLSESGKQIQDRQNPVSRRNVYSDLPQAVKQESFITIGPHQEGGGRGGGLISVSAVCEVDTLGKK